MKEQSEYVFTKLLPRFGAVCKYFVLIHEAQLIVLKSYVQLKWSRFSQLRGLEVPIFHVRHKPLDETSVKSEFQKHQKGMQKTTWSNLDVQSFRDQIF